MTTSAAIAERVRVAPAVKSERPLVEGLFQFYAYDFSEMEPAGSADFEFNAHGCFDNYSYMADYWRDPDRWPLLIRLDGRLTGFALVNTFSHLSGGRVERNMAEFFVARKFRREGVAQEAVRQILTLHPARWEVAVVERNTAAKAFWPRAIAAAPSVRELEQRKGDGVHWNGPIWTFRSVA
jgi:predicted acetyltransferase